MFEIFIDDAVGYHTTRAIRNHLKRYEPIFSTVGQYRVHAGAPARMDCGPEAEVEAKAEADGSICRETRNICKLKCSDLIASCPCNKKEDWSFDMRNAQFSTGKCEKGRYRRLRQSGGFFG